MSHDSAVAVPSSPSASAGADGATASFGFREVPLGEKQHLVDDVFHKVADRYDLMNDLMSGGLHRLWKDAMVARLSPPRIGRRAYEVIDVAGGTGDIAFRIARRSDRRAHVTVCDINASMLGVGRARAEKRGLAEAVDFVEGNAEDLPFEANRFDAYTIAFGIRNVPRIDRALAEAHRVLKPGGRLLVLEFSPVDTPILDRLYDVFSFKVIPLIGKVVAGDAEPYRYLVESIRAFPPRERFAEMIRAAGFRRVDWTDYTGGIAVLHSGWKI
jgi:demethylmenaquinone methyltransferase/2-methoxy-6-polyprenyl-1,4-benzoquinol methylase